MRVLFNMLRFLFRILIFLGIFSSIGRFFGFNSNNKHFNNRGKQKVRRFKTSDKEVEDANFEEVDQ